MPQIADITATDAAGVSVTFKALVPASGETPALWRAQSVVPVPAAQPYLSIGHRKNADRSAQKLTGILGVPIYTTDSVTGKVSVTGTVPFNFTVTKPDSCPDNFAANYAAYVQSVVSSALFHDMLVNAFSST